MKIGREVEGWKIAICGRLDDDDGVKYVDSGTEYREVNGDGSRRSISGRWEINYWVVA